jgi:diguanylate cyclase (GGDEF)-like protein
VTKDAHSPGEDAPSESDRSGEDRDRIAEGRDERAEAHDQVSVARDERAAARDARAVEREQTVPGGDRGAAGDRAGALRDRRGGASDRTQAADDRQASASDREAASGDRVRSARERADFAIDSLTGAYRRDAGLMALAREIARAQRMRQTFTLAFVDVDDLKGTNDRLGHAAGDLLLKNAADAIRTQLRAYDLVIRFGGDEFVCALPDVSAEDVAERFARANAILAENHQASITVGLAELDADDTLEDLVERADAAMYGKRHGRAAEA